VSGEVVGFHWHTDRLVPVAGTAPETRDRLDRVHVRTADGRVHPIQFGICLNAAGAEARNVARLAGIGLGKKSMAVDIPIMSRCVFVAVVQRPSVL